MGSAPAATGGSVSAGGGVSISGSEGWSDNQGATIAHIRACDQNGLVVMGRVSVDGSFSYFASEYVSPYFVTCMRNQGHTMRSFGREELTNFGSR